MAMHVSRAERDKKSGELATGHCISSGGLAKRQTFDNPWTMTSENSLRSPTDAENRRAAEETMRLYHRDLEIVNRLRKSQNPLDLFKKELSPTDLPFIKVQVAASVMNAWASWERVVARRLGRKPYAIGFDSRGPVPAGASEAPLDVLHQEQADRTDAARASYRATTSS